MRPPAGRWAIVGAAALAYASTAALSRAQDATAPAPPSSEATTPAEVKPTPSVLAGAANLTAAEHALQRMIAADESRTRASQEADGQKQKTEGEAAQLEAEARLAKLEAFHPAEFAKTRDAARKGAFEAERRRNAAEKLVAEAAARHEKADAAAKAPKDAESEDAAEAKAELVKRKAELDAATKSKEKTVEAAILASVAAGRANEAVDAATIALALTAARATALDRATTEAGATRDTTLASAAEMQKTIDEKKVESFDKWLEARTKLHEYRQRLPALEAAKESARLTPTASDSETLDSGTRLSWGITGSLLRFQTQRSENLPGRSRNFSTAVRVRPR